MVWRAKDKKTTTSAATIRSKTTSVFTRSSTAVRTMFKNAKTAGDEKWHLLRVTMVGTKITCYLDGQKLLEADDATFKEAGMIGLWSKADAQSYFDDLNVAESE